MAVAHARSEDGTQEMVLFAGRGLEIKTQYVHDISHCFRYVETDHLIGEPDGLQLPMLEVGDENRHVDCKIDFFGTKGLYR